MSQTFSRAADTWLRLALLAILLAATAGILVLTGLVSSQFVTRANIVPDQPAPFSHQHHVAGLGLDCRYCHTSVEVSAVAGFPPTKTCMTCHSQLWTDADLLQPIRQSWADGKAVHWRRVHNLPDYAYFDHSVHVSAGVGCAECHGAIDRMPLTRQGNILRMRFCIECHQDPAPHLRRRAQVFDMDWVPPDDRRALGTRLIAEYGIDAGNLTHCYVCHR